MLSCGGFGVVWLLVDRDVVARGIVVWIGTGLRRGSDEERAVVELLVVGLLAMGRCRLDVLVVWMATRRGCLDAVFG